MSAWGRGAADLAWTALDALERRWAGRSRGSRSSRRSRAGRPGRRSSDAAAVLVGADRLLRLGLGPARLERWRRAGVRRPFFVRGGAEWAEGRGEALTPARARPVRRAPHHARRRALHRGGVRPASRGPAAAARRRGRAAPGDAALAGWSRQRPLAGRARLAPALSRSARRPSRPPAHRWCCCAGAARLHGGIFPDARPPRRRPGASTRPVFRAVASPFRALRIRQIPGRGYQTASLVGSPFRHFAEIEGRNAVERHHSGGLDPADRPAVPHAGTPTRHDGGSTMKARLFTAAAALTAILAALGGTVYGR